MPIDLKQFTIHISANIAKCKAPTADWLNNLLIKNYGNNHGIAVAESNVFGTSINEWPLIRKRHAAFYCFDDKPLPPTHTVTLNGYGGSFGAAICSKIKKLIPEWEVKLFL